jgi:hypothetical protein
MTANFGFKLNADEPEELRPTGARVDPKGNRPGE